MPAAWKTTKRCCLKCSKPLILRNARDLSRRRFCSRQCNAAFHTARRWKDPSNFTALLVAAAKPNLKKGRSGRASKKWKAVERPCEHCNKPFDVPPYKLKLRQGRFCSKACYIAAGGNGPVTKLPKKAVVCKICGAPSWVLPCVARTRKYCSKRCTSIASVMAQRGGKRRSGIEIKLSAALRELGLPFEEQKPLLGVTVADHFLPERVVIYADGDYWHSRPGAAERDARINAKLRGAGFTVLRFREALINTDINAVKNSITQALCQLAA